MKKLLMLLLSVAMLTQFAACNNNNLPNETSDQSQETTVSTGETRTPHNVPEGTTFGGATYTAGFFAGLSEHYFTDK